MNTMTRSGLILPQDELTLPDEFYDESESGDFYSIPVVLENPTREERKFIRILKTIYKGVMFVCAPPRQGKDLFVIWLAYSMKRFFNRPIWLDLKPRKLFGYYNYFNPKIMLDEITKMAKLAEVKSLVAPLNDKQGVEFEKASNEWISQNEVKLKGAFFYLSELGRYCPHRNPMNRVNRFIGALNTQWGHLDMLMVGTHTQENEIDKKTYLEKVNHWVKCAWNAYKFSTTTVRIERGIWLTEEGYFNVGREPIIFDVNGGKPRSYLTTPATIFTITSKGVEEAGKVPALAYLKSRGSSSASVIAMSLKIGLGDVLKDLYVLSMGGYVVGNRLFDLWNSKNMVNLKPTLRVEV